MEMLERQMGDSKNAHGDEAFVEDTITAQTKKVRNFTRMILKEMLILKTTPIIC